MSRKMYKLLLPVFAIAGMAMGVSSASATEVTPASSAMTAKLVAGTEATFTPENGVFAISVKCAASSTAFTTPSNSEPASGPPFFNNNPANAIPSTLAGGSVLTNLTTTPTFTTCTSATGVTTTVATNTTNGKWSLDWNVLNSAAAPWTTAAIGVPRAGAAITLVAAGKTCVLTVDPETAQGIIGYWKNGKNEVVEVKGKEASTLFINEQVFYAATAATKEVCENTIGIKNSDSPAVFRAAYTVENAAKEGPVEKF